MIRTASLTEIREVIAAKLIGADTRFSSVSTDTRTLQAGDLYVALQGPNFDGSAFLAQAKEKGASAAVVSSQHSVELPQLIVANPLHALGALAGWNRKLSTATVVAITGSQGKTTVKEMVGSIMRERHKVLVTRGNLNNEIGAPLTLLQLAPEHEFAVIELGASGAGEIAYTVALTQPKVVVINNAAAAHLEGFGSLAGIVAAKGEIIDGVAEDGVVVLNADDPALPIWAQRAGSRTRYTFSVRGPQSAADFYATDTHSASLQGSRCTIHTPIGAVDIQLQLAGAHNIANAVAATAVAIAAGISLAEIASGLEKVQPVAGRLRTLNAVNGAHIIDDSYNASPAAFRAAIDVLAQCAGERILVMGDMAELGTEATAAHRETGAYALSQNIDELWATGTFSALAVSAFGSRGRLFADRNDLIDALRSRLKAQTTVLVKGSRSSNMDLIVDQISRQEAE